MIDPIKYKEFELWVGCGDVAPDPNAETPSQREVPPLTGLADKLKTIAVGSFIGIRCDDSGARRIITTRVDSAQRKIIKTMTGKAFTVSTEWWGVKITRTK